MLITKVNCSPKPDLLPVREELEGEVKINLK